MSLLVDAIASTLGQHGLIARGAFSFSAGEDRPAGPSGGPARAVLLVGQAGGAAWPHFSRWRETQISNLSDPLDAWSREVIGAVATRFGARAVSPSDRPFLPFQQWAMRAEGIKPSPIGVLMHPRYGLWHAYRGALLFDVAVSIQRPDKPIHPCDACAGKPCMNSCPAEAFAVGNFDYPACQTHLRSPEGQTCMEVGCLARNACPVGAEWRYPRPMRAFHMSGFGGKLKA